jgi:heme exporter protein C
MTESNVLHTGTRGSRVIGVLALVGLAWMLLWALVISPPDEVQGDNVRFFYLHVPAAFAAYIAFGVTALSSAMYLWKRTRSLTWDRIAGCSAEIGVLLTALMLATGMIWGKLSWGVYWRWDARLTSSLLLLVMFIGYMALRGLDAAPEVRAKRCAIVGLVAFLDVPLVHYSVTWWRTLHQTPTLKVKGADINGSMLFSFFIAMIAFILVYVWLMMHRNRVGMMEQAMDDHGLQLAIAERHAEVSA